VERRSVQETETVTPTRTFATFVVAFVLALVVAAAAPRDGRAQEPTARDTAQTDSSQMYVLRTRDGSLFIGRLVRATIDSVYFISAGGPITVPRSTVVELRQLGRGAMRQGVYWPPNPGDTRLFFAPTGRMLEKGEGYFSDTYLFFLNFVGGVTSRFTFGGGFSIFPFSDFSDNIFYVTPKLGVVQTPNLNVAVGALVAAVGGEGSFGIVYGVGTVGSPDASVSFGTGVAYADGDLADQPLVMFGGERRVARRLSLVTENYVVPSDDAGTLLSYGVRFFGDRLSVDLAFWNLFGDDVDTIFPGIPYVAFAVRF
jgi:hypothetical protein